MTDERRQTYTLHARGELLEVETRREGDRGHATLRVDGEVVAQEGGGEDFEHTDLLEDTPHHTRVQWGWRTGKPSKVLLVEPGSGEVKKRSVPFAPPPGTRAGKIHAWGERHPTLYAGRHVAANLGGTAAAILGVGAFIRLVLEPLIPDVDGPDLPDVNWPDWLKYLDPFRYLEPLFAWIGDLLDPLFDAIRPLVDWIPDGVVKALIGLTIAVIYAVREVRRRRRIVEGPPPDETPAPIEDAAPSTDDRPPER